MSTTNDTPRFAQFAGGTLLKQENGAYMLVSDHKKQIAELRRNLWDLVEELKFCAWKAPSDGEKFAFESSAEKLRAILLEGSK